RAHRRAPGSYSRCGAGSTAKTRPPRRKRGTPSPTSQQYSSSLRSPPPPLSDRRRQRADGCTEQERPATAAPAHRLASHTGTLPGSLYLGIVAVLPNLFYSLTQGNNQNFPFGGTAVLIMVGVGLDTVKQIESQLMQRNYEGFLR